MTTPLDLGALFATIAAEIQAAFPALQTVEFHRVERKGLVTPALLLEMAELEAEPNQDPGTEQLAVAARFEAYVVMGFRTPDVRTEVRRFAAAFAAWLRLRRWPGIPTDAAQVIGCYPDNFDPELDQFETWRIEWSQVLHLGASVWDNDGTVPTTILTAWSPDIGAGNEDKYTSLDIPPLYVDAAVNGVASTSAAVDQLHETITVKLPAL